LPSSIRLRSFGASDRGRRRPHNEDAFHCDDAYGLYIVADGVGGHAKGEVASQEAIDQIGGYVRQGRRAIAMFRSRPSDDAREEVRRLLESAVQSACYMVFGLSELDPAQRGMSTTISALLLVENLGVVAQVGDSRVYRVREGRAHQLTEDHTLVNHKLKRGLITEAEARTMKNKNVITRAVGHKDFVEVDTHEIDVLAGDRYLLCSDGLHGYLQPGDVEQHVTAAPAQELPARFVALANERGGRDNITAVIVCVD
jgi:protein phosphatase